jgi:hypothetical protein
VQNKNKQQKTKVMLELSGINEYNNSGALMGLDAADHEELMGYLNGLDPITRFKVMNKISGNGVSQSKGSRAEMEKLFPELPDHIKEGLKKHELRLADTLIYSRKPVNSKTIKMFETQDVKAVGLRNISNGKLPKNQALAVSGVFLLAGVIGPNVPMSDDAVMSAAYGKIEDYPAIANGEFTLKANKKIILGDVCNCVFKTSNNNQLPFGYFKLANPRLIVDDVQLEATIELGSLNGVDTSRTFLYVGLHGTITTP